MGIFSNEMECVVAFEEAVLLYKTPSQLRFLFLHMLVNECIQTPIDFWERFKAQLSYDFFLRARGNIMVAETRCLETINRHLEEYGRELSDFGITFIQPSEGEIYRELTKWYPFLADLAEESLRAVSTMTSEQLKLYQDVISAVYHEIGRAHV